MRYSALIPFSKSSCATYLQMATSYETDHVVGMCTLKILERQSPKLGLRGAGWPLFYNIQYI